jgi:YihY family inner membrane protein
MLSRLWLLTRRVLHEYGDDNCSHMAAAISYYVLFSIIPLAIFSLSVFGFVVRNDELQQDVASEIVDFLNVEEGTPLLRPVNDAIEAAYGQDAPTAVQDAIDEFNDDEAQQLADLLDAGDTVTISGYELNDSQVQVRANNVVVDTLQGVADVSGPLSIVGLVGMAWAGTAMFGAVRKALNIAFDAESHRPIVQQKLVDLSLVAGLGVLLTASVASTGALRTLRTLSDENLGPLSTGSGFFWSIVPLFLPAVFSFLVFLIIFQYVPNTRTPFRSVWPGAAFATVLFELLKNLFAVYVANFNNYAGAYGALGILLLFLLWLYLASNILLVGAEVASEYPRVMRGDYDNMSTGPPQSIEDTVRRFARGLFLHHKDEEPEKAGDGAADSLESGEGDDT